MFKMVGLIYNVVVIMTAEFYFYAAKETGISR